MADDWRALIEENRRIYEREIRMAPNIIQRNRHDSVNGRWYGPEAEVSPAGPTCPCAGCIVRFRGGEEG